MSIYRVHLKKFLSIELDEKLTFEQHIKHISKNALKGLSVMWEQISQYCQLCINLLLGFILITAYLLI